MIKTLKLLVGILFFSISFSNYAQNQKIVLFEHFTSTSCPSCGNLNPEFYELINNYQEQIVCISYHNKVPLNIDPFFLANPDEICDRAFYYFMNTSPGIIIDGVDYPPASPLITEQALQDYLNQMAPVSLEVTESVNGIERIANVNISVDQSLITGNYRLRVAVVEKQIYFPTYFESNHEHVFRKFLTGSQGLLFDNLEAGETTDFQFSYIPESDWDLNQIYLIAFIQNDQNKEIINASASTPFEYFDNIVLSANVIQNICLDGNEGQINLNLDGGIPPYEVVWSNGETGLSISDLENNIYTAEINDAIGNEVTETFEISGGVELNYNAIVNPDINNSSSGSVTIIVSGGSDQYEVYWSDGYTGFSRGDLNAGIYTGFILDNEFNCEIEWAVEVMNDFQALQAYGNITNVSCNGEDNGQIDLNISGGYPPYEYAWSSGQTDEDISELEAGSYTCVISDDNGTLISRSFTIEEPDSLEILFSTNPEFENNFNAAAVAIPIGGTPPYSFVWSTGDTINQIDSLSSGIYACVVTDANNCSAVATVTIDQQFQGGIDIVTQDVSCFGLNDGSVEFLPFGQINAVDYIWFSQNSSGIQTNNLAPGDYAYIAIDDFNNVVDSGYFEIQEPDSLTFVLSVGNGFEPGIAALDTIMGGNAPYSIEWSDGSSAYQVDNLGIGMNNVSVTDINGCNKIQTFTSYQNEIIIQDVTCNGGSDGSIEFVINDNYEYEFFWTTGSLEPQINGVQANTYGVLISDFEGNIYNFNPEVKQPDLIQTEVLTSADTGYSDASINVSVSGGISPYNFVWSNGSNDSSLNNLSAGIYQLTLIDANNCFVQEEVEILYEPIAVSVESTMNEFELLYQHNSSFLILKNDLNVTFNLEVFNTKGQLVYNMLNEKSFQKIDLSHLEKGCYLLLLRETSGKQMGSLKIIR